MELNRFKVVFFISLASCFGFACGAPTKTASEVSGIFRNPNATSLGGLLTELCQNLRQRQQAPNMSKASLTDEECAQAGVNADNYKSVKKAFYFEGLTNQVTKAEGKEVLNIRTRAKVWLNHNILDLALKMTKALKQRTNGGDDIFNKPADASGGDGLEKLIKVTTKELKRIEFNQTNRTFSGTLNLSGDGLVTLNNDIDITGQIFSDSIGLNISTPRSTPFSQSLLKDVSAIGIITPYANDVYVDITFEVNVHSIGLNSLLVEKISSALGSAIKTAMDALLKVK